MTIEEIIKSIEDHAERLEARLKEALALVEKYKAQAENAAAINANPYGINEKDAEEWLQKTYPDEDPCPFNEWPGEIKEQYNNRKESDK